MPTQPASVVCQIQNNVARITLNRPPLNILDIPMIGELHEALARVRSANDANVLVIAHAGKAFSAGVSIQDHAPDKVGEMLGKFHGMIGLLHSLDIPSIALVDGMALGGGCELAVVCDMVLASDRSVFGQPEIKVGVFPPVAAALFPSRVGRNRALELLLTGESIDAAEAHRIGLINKVFPAATFGDMTGEFIRKLTSLSGSTLRLTKRAVNRGLDRSLSEGIAAAEQLYLGELMPTEDAREGLNAFLEKRKPVWKNQ
jgi:cyclohexa-1,5-dienecarbonyl-CoA hydratase